MRNQKQVAKINNKESEIFYNNSKASNQDEPKIFTYDVLTVVTELLSGFDTNFIYQSGITTLGTLTSWDEPRLSIKRLSNKMIEIRKVLPKGSLLTFKPLNEKEWKYGVIKTDENIKLLKSLQTQILNYLVKKK